MINLVPPEFKKRKGVRSLGYVAMLAYFAALATLLLGFAGLATYNYVQKISLNSQQAELDRIIMAKKQDEHLFGQAAFIQDRVKNVAKYQDKTDWNQVLAAIASSTPTNSQLTSIKIASIPNKPSTIAVSGISTDRRSIILYKDKLAATTPFNAANITNLAESASLTAKTYTFTINISLKK